MTSTDRAAYIAKHRQAIEAAANRIRPYIRRTPVLTTDLDPKLVLKPECFQVTGSFKARGAFNAILRLKETNPNSKGVIAVSSGNHAQALALAARTAGFKAVILIPADANPAKVAATRAYGAEVIDEGITFDNREQRMREVMQERGLTLVHPFDNWDIIHGQGTAALELLQDRPDADLVVAPVGGGGLLSGTGLASKFHNPKTRVIGVEPELADDARQSLKTGRIQTLPRAPDTIADGVRTVSIGPRTFEVIVENKVIDDIVTVTEREIQEALLTAYSRLKLAVEPTGALPLAAYLAGKLPSANRIALILSGGNANPKVVAEAIRATAAPAATSPTAH